MRGLWAETDRVLSTLEGDRKAVESVIRGQVDLYTLDGQDLSVKIPTALRERMERLSHQVRVIEIVKNKFFLNMKISYTDFQFLKYVRIHENYSN